MNQETRKKVMQEFLEIANGVALSFSDRLGIEPEHYFSIEYVFWKGIKTGHLAVDDEHTFVFDENEPPLGPFTLTNFPMAVIALATGVDLQELMREAHAAFEPEPVLIVTARKAGTP